MASEITKEFIYNIEILISNKDDQAILDLVSEEHPADIAEIIEDLNLKDGTYLFVQIEIGKACFDQGSFVVVL